MALIQTPPDLISQPNVEFRKNDFDAAIWNKGYDVIVEKARKCPCSINGRALPTCQNCRGLGYVFINPTKTKAIVSSINTDSKIKEWSETNTGRYQVTLIKYNDPSDYSDRLAFMDRITFVDQYNEFCEAIKLRTDDDGNRFGFTSYEIDDLVDGFIFESSDKPLINLVKGKELIIGDNDYVVKVNKDVDSITDFNEALTLYYKHRIQYCVIDIPHDIRASKVKDSNGNFNTIQLPINAIVQHAHISFDRPDYEGGDPINNSYLGMKAFIASDSNTFEEVYFDQGDLGYKKKGDNLEGLKMSQNEEGELIISDTNGRTTDYYIDDNGYLNLKS